MPMTPTQRSIRDRETRSRAKARQADRASQITTDDGDVEQPEKAAKGESKT